MYIYDINFSIHLHSFIIGNLLNGSGPYPKSMSVTLDFMCRTASIRIFTPRLNYFIITVFYNLSSAISFVFCHASTVNIWQKTQKTNCFIRRVYNTFNHAAIAHCKRISVYLARHGPLPSLQRLLMTWKTPRINSDAIGSIFTTAFTD